MSNLVFLRDIRKIGLILLVGLSSAYLTTVTSFSPFYFGYAVAGICFCITILWGHCIRCPKILLTLFCFFCVLFLYQYVNIVYSKTLDFRPLILVLLNHGSTIIAFGLCNRLLSLDPIQKSIKCYFYVAVAIGVIDIVYRFIHRGYSYSGYLFFYNFKSNSILFTDSNWVGFIFMISFAFFLYLRDCFRIVGKAKIAVFFFLCLTSFSRAAIFSCGIVYLFSRFLHYGKHKRKIVFFMGILSCCVFLPFLIVIFLNDPSFQTKITILKGLLYYIQQVPTDRLFLGFGAGFSTSDAVGFYTNYAGIYGHLYIVIKLMDSGIIGFFLELLFFLYVIIKTNFKFLYLFIPFFICGLSMCPTNLSYLYIFSGIMLYLENYHKALYGGNVKCR